MNGEKVFRILALRDIPVHDVAKGDMGGFVSGYANLSQSGDCWIGKEAIVEGEAVVCDDAWVSTKAHVFGKSRIQDKACVYRSARVGNSKVKDTCEVYGTAVLNLSTLEGEVIINQKAELMACRLYGKIVVKSEAFLKETIIRGKDIYILGKAVVKTSVIGTLEEEAENVTISGEAKLDGVGMYGNDILIEDNATLESGVRVSGSDIRISDHSFLEGCIRILSRTDIGDLVQVRNSDVKKGCQEYGEIILRGDLQLGN